ncbi:MAG: zf-HC2 domain-containing protein [Clostridia bacterium]|nr:zf-HC2 domain-containing protein [Clostridia bacterium]
MKNKRECKIIQDLLPNYVEELTNEETNIYIEEHLESCTECKKICENMKENMNIRTEKSDKKDIKYFKKYRNKLGILKFILFIILAIFILVIGRRMIIIKSLQNKVNDIKANTNFHMVQYDYEGVHYRKNEVYSKDGKTVLTITQNNTNGLQKLTKYTNEDKSNIYIETNENKVAILNQDASFPPNYTGIKNYIETNTLGEFILNILRCKITTANMNGKECYKIDQFFSTNYLYGTEEGWSIYIDKETGLPVRTFGETLTNENGTFTTVNDYQYEFDIVTDEAFIEPDINEYEVQ